MFRKNRPYYCAVLRRSFIVSNVLRKLLFHSMEFRFIVWNRYYYVIGFALRNLRCFNGWSL